MATFKKLPFFMPTCNHVSDCAYDITISAAIHCIFMAKNHAMITQFDSLTSEEIGQMLKAPALVSVLASSADSKISDKEKAEAVELSHLKTFTSEPLLRDYYKAVENVFQQNFEVTIAKYSPFDDAKRSALKDEIDALSTVFAKLDKPFAEALHDSLSGYAKHVNEIDRSVFEYFLFPFPLPGITD